MVSTISRFCATVGLGAHAHGFLSAHACVVRARLCACALVCVSGVRMRACLGVRMHVWVPECVHGCVSMYMLAGMCARVRMCQCAWLRAWASACVSGRLYVWLPACLHICVFIHISVFDCSLPGILQPSIAIFFSMASARQGSPEVNSYTIGNPGFPQQ